jgi:hypothetical protein
MAKHITFNWTFSSLNSKKMYILPAGSYFIGDINYVIGDSPIYDIYGKTAYDYGYYESKYGCFLVDEVKSDFCHFIGSDGKKYMVDNSVIGIISLNLISDPDTSGGHIYTFDNEVGVRMNNGVFRFNSYYNDNTYFDLVINTLDKDDANDSE